MYPWKPRGCPGHPAHDIPGANTNRMRTQGAHAAHAARLRADDRRHAHYVGIATALVPRYLGAHPRGVRVPRPLGMLCHAGMLCSLSPTNAAGQGGRLVVHLSASSPVALL